MSDKQKNIEMYFKSSMALSLLRRFEMTREQFEEFAKQAAKDYVELAEPPRHNLSQAEYMFVVSMGCSFMVIDELTDDERKDKKKFAAKAAEILGRLKKRVH